jgi:D-alanyl-lipoteichoic acid acyltransferase DltB (MBOAT superfamily)
LYWITPHRWRWLLLLTASYFFYASWNPAFLLLIILSTLVDFGVGRNLPLVKDRSLKKLLLATSLVANVGLLFIFKYLHMFLPEKDPMLLSIFEADHPFLAPFVEGVYLSVPVGISFYTFQTLSYSIDVFRGDAQPQKHLGKFGLFVSYFPQLVAGPIERYSSLMPQLEKPAERNYKRWANAFRLMLYGFFVKIVVADNLALLVDEVYASPLEFGSGSVVLATFLFGIQIYADFSGYSLIAQGVAKSMGVDLMDNFRSPYFSKSISQFWQRWHISLSTWFRDYVYFPLGGNRVGVPRWVINILIVFAVSGFWHGADWAFIIWGMIHGLMYLIERFVFRPKASDSTKLKTVVGGLFTYAMINVAWLFFRAGSMSNVNGLIDALKLPTMQWPEADYRILVILVFFTALDFLLRTQRFDTWAEQQHTVKRWTIYGLMVWMILVWGGPTDHPFIYFQF